MTPATLRAITFSAFVLGLAGCDNADHSAPSPLPVAPTPFPAAGAFAVHSIEPHSGASWRSTAVEIAGDGFQPSTTVRFGSALAGSVRVVTAQYIWAGAPLGGAGTVDVVVTNPDGQRATLAAAYTFDTVPLPTLTTSASVVAPGGQLAVSWKTAATGDSDWVALFPTANVSNSEFGAAWWQYTKGTTTGTLTLAAPQQPGQYEFRYLPDDGYADVARSGVVTVSGSSLVLGARLRDR